MAVKVKTGATSGLGSLVAKTVTVAAITMAQVGSAISLAVLVFVGGASPSLPRAITSFVLGGAIAAGFIAWRSSLPVVIAGAQDTVAVVLVAVTATIAANTSGDPAVAAVVLVGITSLITGIVMYLLGRFQLSAVVRYLPMTVVGAFVAGTGWLLFKGGLDVMVSESLGRSDIGRLFESDLLVRWLPGFALGLTMVLLGRSKRVPSSAASLAVLAALCIFYISTAFSSLGAAEDAGWLIGPFPDAAGFQFITPGEIGEVSGSGLRSVAPGLLSVILVSLVGILLNLSGLEHTGRGRIDLDAEMRTAGLLNMVIAPFGALTSYHKLGDTALAKSLGTRSRGVALGVAAAGTVIAFVGTTIVGFLPRFVPGGLLIGVGLGLLIEWVAELRTGGISVEKALSVLIVASIAFVGVLEGIALGVVAACAVFVIRYSQIDPVRLELSGTDMSSRVDRSPAAEARLATRSDAIAIYTLQGYLFFGTTSSLVERIVTRCQGGDPRPEVVILDLRHVTGLDHSTLALLQRMSADVGAAGTVVLWSGLADQHRDTLIEAGKDFPDLDQAIEAAEDLLLTPDAVGSTPHTDFSPELAALFTTQTLTAGERLLTQGEPSDAVYVLVEGTLTAWHTAADGTVTRFRRFTGNALLGEIGFVSSRARTADIVADTDATVLALDRSTFATLRAEQPAVALELQDYLLTRIAHRLVATNVSLGSAMR